MAGAGVCNCVVLKVMDCMDNDIKFVLSLYFFLGFSLGSSLAEAVTVISALTELYLNINFERVQN